MQKIQASTIQELQMWKVGFFRFKKFSNTQYLITNDAGKFHFLDEGEFYKFVSGNIEELTDYENLLQKGFIKDERYEKRMIWSVAQKNLHVWQWPVLHMIIVTLRCNHKCKYCHAAVAPMTATEFDMSQETAQKVVDTIMYSNAPSLTIEFQWWEALVNYPVVQFIVEYARERAQHLKKKLSFSLVSNLTLLTEEKLTWLLDRGVDICTSLDGDEITHNSNRAWYDGNSFERVTYWMKRLDEEKKKRNMWNVWALLTVTKETLPKYKTIIDSYVWLWLESIFLRWLNPYGFAASDLKTLAYDSEQWMEFYEKSLDYIIDLNKKWTFFREQITAIYLMKIFYQKDPNFMDIRSPSGVAIGGVAYNYDGKVYASDESRMLARMGIEDFKMTDLLWSGEETYKAMINSPITKIAVQSSCLDGLPGYNKHVYKPYIGVDIIHNFKTTGNIYTPLVKDKKMQMQVAILDIIFTKLQDPEVEKIFKSWI